MASSREYLSFIMERLSGLDEVSHRKMMGEYLIYCRGRLVGGIYDDRFLVKPTRSTLEMMPNARRELPYEGAKEMLLVEECDDPRFMCALLEAMAQDMPAPKRR